MSESVGLESVVRELGGIVDEHVSDGSWPRLRLEELEQALAFRARSQLHATVYERERLLLASKLLLPGERRGQAWPYVHPLHEPITLREGHRGPFADDEARRHHVARAEQCRSPALEARFADCAHLLTSGPDRPRWATRSIDAALVAFSASDEEESTVASSALLLRAAEIAVSLRMKDRLPEIAAAVESRVRSRLQADRALPLVLLVEPAETWDRRRELIDYAGLAEELESRADSKESRLSPYGPAFVVGTLDRSERHEERCDRIARKHVEAMIDAARSFLEPAEGESANTFAARHHLMEAWRVVQSSRALADLAEVIRKELHRVGVTADDSMVEHELEVPMTEEHRTDFESRCDRIVEAGVDWPRMAARTIMAPLRTRADLEADASESLFSQFITCQRVEAGHVKPTPHSDWRHRAREYLHPLLMGVLWPHVLAPAISRLWEDDLIDVPVLCRPFARQIETGADVLVLESAAGHLVRGDVVAAAQAWTLMMEKVLRTGVERMGGTTTVVDREGGDREAVFDTSVSLFKKHLAEADPELAERVEILISCLFSWHGIGGNWRNLVAHSMMEEWGTVTAWTPYFCCVAVALLPEVHASELGGPSEENEGA